MTGIASGHRLLNGKTQVIMAILQDVTAAQTIGGLINLFNYFDEIKPSGVASTPFEYDTEVIVPSNKTGNTLTMPVDVFFSVTVIDEELKIARNMMLHATADSGASNPDQSLPSGVFVGMDDAFFKSQLNSLGSARKHLNDATVFVDSIIVKDGN